MHIKFTLVTPAVPVSSLHQLLTLIDIISTLSIPVDLLKILKNCMLLKLYFIIAPLHQIQCTFFKVAKVVLVYKKGSPLRVSNRPFYSCVLGCLAFE